MMTCEGSRLEGVILRSQLLVLLQRRHFCDQHGRPVGREYSKQQEIELEVRPQHLCNSFCSKLCVGIKDQCFVLHL